MELLLDLNIQYAVPGLESMVKKFEVVEKVAGKGLENLSYIEKMSGVEVIFNPKWTGIQDGLTFKLRHHAVSGIKEAEYLLRKLLLSVKENFEEFKAFYNLPADSTMLLYESNSATCGICGRTNTSNLSELEEHVASHSVEKTPSAKPPWLLDRPTEGRGEEHGFVDSGRLHAGAQSKNWSPSPERFSPERRYTSPSPTSESKRRYRSPSPHYQRAERYTPERRYRSPSPLSQRAERFTTERRYRSPSLHSQRKQRFIPGRRYRSPSPPSRRTERFSPQRRHSKERYSPNRRRSPSPRSRRSKRFSPERKYSSRSPHSRRSERFSPRRSYSSRSPLAQRPERFSPQRAYTSPGRSRRFSSGRRYNSRSPSPRRSDRDRREYSPVNSPKRYELIDELISVSSESLSDLDRNQSPSRSRSSRRNRTRWRSGSWHQEKSPERYSKRIHSRSRSRSRDWDRKRSRRGHSRSLSRSRSRSPLKYDTEVPSAVKSSVLLGKAASGAMGGYINYPTLTPIQQTQLGIGTKPAVRHAASAIPVQGAVTLNTNDGGNSGMHGMWPQQQNSSMQQEEIEPFPDITQEIILNPHRSEPKYVAHGRKETLLRYRLSGKMSDLDCEKLIILLEPQVQLKNKDKYYLKHIPQELKKNNIDPKNPTKAEKLTAKLMVLCDFLVKKTELRKPDPDKPYPYQKDLRFIAAWEKGSAPWQKTHQGANTIGQPTQTIPFGGNIHASAHFLGPPIGGIQFGALAPPVVLPSAVFPPANQFMGEIPVWVVREWYKDVANFMITRPHFREPVYVAICRRDILLRERAQGMLDDNQTELLLANLTLKFMPHEQERLQEKITQYTNFLGFSMANVPNLTKLLSIKLMATCVFLIERCHVPTTEKKKKDIPYPYEQNLLQACPGPYPGRFFLVPGLPHIGGIPLPIPPVGGLVPSPPASYTPTMVTTTKPTAPVVQPSHVPIVSTKPRSNLIAVKPTVGNNQNLPTTSVVKPDVTLLIPDDDDEDTGVNGRKSPQGKIPNVSCNGQYENFDPSQLSDKLAVQNYVVVLAAQNKVDKAFAKITIPGFKNVHEIKIGNESYVGKSNNTVTEAKRNVAYETLMKTRYAFTEIPEELKMFKPKKGLPTHVIVGVKDPQENAQGFVDILAAQNKIKTKYGVFDNDDGSKKANLTLGLEIFYATEMTEKTARDTVAYIALQRTTYMFTSPPERIISVPPSSQSTNTSNKGYSEIQRKCNDVMAKRKRHELDEKATQAAAKRLKHMGGLSAKEVQLISKKLSKLATMARKAKVHQSGWKWWRVTKHLEYVIDLILKKTSGEKYDDEEWVNEATVDPDYLAQFKLGFENGKSNSEGNGAIDLTKETATEGKTTAYDDDEMDIYEDVMKLEIKQQPLVEPIVLSDDDDDETEMPSNESNKVTESAMASKEQIEDNVTESNDQFTNNNGSTAVCRKESTKPIVIPDDTSGIHESETSTSTPEEIDVEGEQSEDETMTIDDELMESTARTRLHVRKKKTPDTEGRVETETDKKRGETELSTPSKETPEVIQVPKEATANTLPQENKVSTQKTPDVAQMPTEVVHRTVQQQQKVSTEKQKSENVSPIVQEVEKTSASVQQTEPLKDMPTPSVAQPVQKPKRRLISVSAASIAAGVLSGLGVSTEKDSSLTSGSAKTESSSLPGIDAGTTLAFPRIPQIEPEDLTMKPVQERHEAMKKRIEGLLDQREKEKLSNVETGEIIKAIKEHLTADDMVKVNKTTSKLAKQHFKITGEKSPSPAWKLTVRLKVLGRYILHKLQGITGEKPSEEEKNVDEWLKGKAVEYYKELSTGNLTGEQIKERVEALKLNLSEERKIVLNQQLTEECKIILSMLNIRPNWKPLLKNVVDLELTSLYIIQQSSGTQYPICCLLSKTFADILLAKLSEGPVKESEIFKVIKAALSEGSGVNKPVQEVAPEVDELDSTQVKEGITKPTVPTNRKPAGIKLTLTSSTKSNIEAEKRQQSKKALLKAKEDSAVIPSDSDSD